MSTIHYIIMQRALAGNSHKRSGLENLCRDQTFATIPHRRCQMQRRFHLFDVLCGKTDGSQNPSATDGRFLKPTSRGDVPRVIGRHPVQMISRSELSRLPLHSHDRRGRGRFYCRRLGVSSPAVSTRASISAERDRLTHFHTE